MASPPLFDGSLDCWDLAGACCLATGLDAILKPPSERSFRFVHDGPVAVFSFEDGRGNDLRILFKSAIGAAIKGFAHESPLAEGPVRFGMYDKLPPTLAQHVRDSKLFRAREVTFCFWTWRDRANWWEGNVEKTPEEDDGSEYLLRRLPHRLEHLLEFYLEDRRERWSAAQRAEYAKVYRSFRVSEESIDILNPGLRESRRIDDVMSELVRTRLVEPPPVPEVVPTPFERLQEALAVEPDFDPKLRGGASEKQIARFESLVGCGLPEEMRSFYASADGQDPGGDGLFYCNRLRSLSEILRLWRDASKQLRDRDLAAPADQDVDAGIKRMLDNPLWLQFLDGDDTLRLDLDPAPDGRPGQIIAVTEEKLFYCADTLLDLIELPSEAVEYEKYLHQLDSLMDS